MKKKQAVLFDMDGTLIDTFGEMKKEKNGKVPLSRRYFDYRMSKQSSYSYTAMKHMIEHDPIMRFQADKILKNVIDTMYARYERAALKSGAKEFLTRLKEHNYQLCLCTNNSNDMVNYILNQKGLDHVFDHIITSEIVTKPKPDPEMYEKAVSYTGFDKSACVVFEDMLEGVQAAKAAGLDVCVVYDTYNEKDMKQIKDLSNLMIHDYTAPDLQVFFE